MMKLRGLSAFELSRRVGCGEGTSALWLRGRALPPLYRFEAVARELGCDPGWLLFGDRPATAAIGSDAELAAAIAEDQAEAARAFGRHREPGA